MSEKSLKSDSEKVWKSEELYWKRESKKPCKLLICKAFVMVGPESLLYSYSCKQVCTSSAFRVATAQPSLSLGFAGYPLRTLLSSSLLPALKQKNTHSYEWVFLVLW